MLVVNDGSDDDTAAVLLPAAAPSSPIICATSDTAARFKPPCCTPTRGGYDRLITLDADGQHDPAQVRAAARRSSIAGQWDILIGSRYVASADSTTRVPIGRRVGMQLFSTMVG